MSENLFTKKMVHQIAGMNDVSIKQNLQYSKNKNEALLMDIYYPTNSEAKKLKPVVVFVMGYPGPGFSAMIGYKLKEVAQYISWAQFMAASGIIAITYNNIDPEKDVKALLEYIFSHAEFLGIDRNQIGLWSCSGNTPTAFSLLRRDQNIPIKCAVLCYGYMLDADGCTITADAEKQFRFVDPGTRISDLSQKIPLLIVRAGQDEMPGLNISIDKFIPNALTHNLPISCLNLPDAPHAFDITEDKKYAHEAIEHIMFFIKSKLV